ncbi:MAG: FHA domain-containing protein [Deltaproteobacteria bacterium]|nr:FHA domain-containing protein [Deltaproteobacteria bacterium]
MAKLIVMGPDGGQSEFPLGPVNSIGRHPDNAVQILDKVISKEHAVLERLGEHFIIRDLDSRNGTYVNGKRIKEAVLKDRDEISIGSSRILFVAEDSPTRRSIRDRVTIAPQSEKELTFIKTRFEQERSRDFLPADEIYDVEILKRDYEKLRAAHELARTTGGLELDIDTLLQKILDKIFDVLAADRGVILLQEAEGLIPRVLKTRRPGREEDVTLSHTIIDAVVKEKASILSSDATMDSRFGAAHSVIIQGIRSTMCVPLLAKNDLVGIVHLDTQDATGAFTEKDLQILSGIANQAAVLIDNARLVKKIEAEARTRAKLSRFMSPNLVEQVVSGKLDIQKGGEIRETAIMFCDIRGFTSMTERNEAQEIVRTLNEYFELMTDIVFKHEGTLDKYIGDSIMALWGAPISLSEASFKAVTAAIEMREALKGFNALRVQQSLPPIRVGFGIATGQVVAGNLGSSKTMEYTVVGDRVNIASRFCDLAKEDQIIVDDRTLEKVRPHVDFEALEPMRVKGKAEPLPMFNVRGLKPASGSLEAPTP